MRALRRLSVVGMLMLLPALFAPVDAGARRPSPTATLVPLRSLFAVPQSMVGPNLTVARVSSPPAHARPGRAYVLRGIVVDDGAAAAPSSVVGHLLRVGGRPLTIGRADVGLAPRGSATVGVRIRLPRGLHAGSYALIACVRRALQAGELGCATAERHLQIGSRSRVPTAHRATAGASATACSS